jgi:cytochrome c oxidase cbb3-type subunit I/II
VLEKLGVPYTDEDFARGEAMFMQQGQEISDYLAGKDVEIAPNSEMAAIIAYLQRLGRTNEVPQPVMPVPALDDGTTAAAADGGK